MSKFIMCETCGKTIASDADSCPHCGAKNRKKGFFSCSGCLVGIILFVVLSIAVGVSKKNGADPEVLPPPSANMKRPPAPAEEDDKKIIEQSLDYLKTVQELSGFAIQDNNVFLTLKKKELFADHAIVCNAAASAASKALLDHKKSNTSCTVYLLPPDGRPGDKGKYIYSAYADSGMVKSSGDEPFGESIKLKAMTQEERKAYMLDKKAKRNANVFERKFVSSWDGSVRPVVQYVKGQMSDPGSFKHVKTNWWYIKGTTDRYRVKMIFRGKNAFNAVVTNSVDLEVDLNGNLLSK